MHPGVRNPFARNVLLLMCLAAAGASAVQMSEAATAPAPAAKTLAREVDALVQELLSRPDVRRRLEASGSRVAYGGLAWETDPGVRAGTSPFGLELDSAVHQALERHHLRTSPPDVRTRGIFGTVVSGAFRVVGPSARVLLSLVDAQSGRVVAEAKRVLEPRSLVDFGVSQLLPPGSEDARVLAQLVGSVLGNGPQAFPISLRTERGPHAAYFEGEALGVLIETERDCHVRLYHISWTEKRLTLIFPNRSEPNGFVPAGTAVRVPAQGGGAVFEVARPYGVDAIVAIASEQPFADEAVVQAKLAAEAAPGSGGGEEPAPLLEAETPAQGLDDFEESVFSSGAEDVQLEGEFLSEGGIDEQRTRGVLTRGLVVRHETPSPSGAGTVPSLAAGMSTERGTFARAVCYFTTLPRVSFAR